MKKIFLAGLLLGAFCAGNNFAQATPYDITQFSGNNNSLINRTTPFQNGDTLNFLNDVTMTENMYNLGPDTLTINGNGKTLNGTTSIWGFTTNVGSNYTVNDLTFSNITNHWGLTRMRDGIAIENQGTLNINNSSFVNGTIYDTGYGVSIYSDTSTATNISGSTFSGNTGTKNVNGTVFIYTDSTLNVSDSMFSGNVLGENSNGAAIYISDNSSVNIDNSDFIGNRLNGDAAETYKAQGGAIRAGVDTTSNITNSRFTGNVATNNSYGGAIYSMGDVSISGSTLSGNSARYGGAVAVEGADLTVIDSTLSENTSENSGGAIFVDGNVNIEHSTISDNESSDNSGGAIFSTGNITIKNNSTISGNTATRGGGAIYTYGNLTVENSTISGNSATDNNQNGGAAFVNGNLTVTGSTISDNTTTGNGGGIYTNGNIINITDSTFDNNKATNGEGGAIKANSAYGGFTVSGSTFTRNSSTGKGGAINSGGGVNISDSTFSYNEGGAVSSSGGNIVIDDSQFDHNKGWTVFANSSITANNTSFLNNTGSTSEAVVAASVVNLDHATFSDNTAGMIVRAYGGLEIKNGSLFENNTSTGSEGPIIYYSNTTVSGSEFNNNHSNGNGGALDGYGALTLSDSRFYKNSANLSGGALASKGNPSTINHVEFEENSAEENGGAIYRNGADVTITNSTFTNNTAKLNGGAIYNNSGNLNIIADNGITSFTGNKANGVSNAVHLNGGTLNLNAGNNGIITFNDRISSTSTDNKIEINSGSTLTDGRVNLYEGTNTVTANMYSGNLYIGKYNTDNIVFDNTILNLSGGTTQITDANFINNSLITNTSTNEVNIFNTEFRNNIATTDGGAIKNIGDGTITPVMNIYNSTFDSNTAEEKGGAIYNKLANLNIYNSVFSENGTTDLSDWTQGGGSIYNDSGVVNVVNSEFRNNTLGSMGGVILNTGATSDLTISNSIFANNLSDVGSYGIVYNYLGNVSIENSTFSNTGDMDLYDTVGVYNESGSVTISNSRFDNMSSYAVYNDGYSDVATMDISNSSFVNNTAISAIRNSGNLTVSNSIFSSNATKFNDGGAIFNDGGTVDVSNSAFSQNQSVSGNGGAIYNAGGTTNLKNSTFSGNSAALNGGAIYNQSGTVNVIADNGLTMFSGNKANGASNAVYLESGTLNLNAGNGGEIILNDKIVSFDKSTSTINLNSTGGDVPASAPVDGKIYLNQSIDNSTVNLYNGTLLMAKDNLLNNNNLTLAGGTINMINGSAGTMALSGLNLANGTTTNLQVDADLANLAIDRLTSSSTPTGTGMINVSRVNLLSDAKTDNVFLNFVDPSISDQVTLGVNSALGKIYQYNIAYNSTSGQLNFSAPTGFNPAVLPASVASNTGNYINQVNSYGQAFFNMDSFMLSPQLVRNEAKYANRYADAAGPTMFSPLMQADNNKGLWFRPYTTFENVPLKNGPTVSNVAYGMFIGGDSPITSLGHGFDGNFTLYAGYNGSHQAYDGIGVYQNGGMLGATGTVYKGNFFSALTANVGSSSGEASTMFGTDYFNMISAGIASKTGYNWELLRGKFIIQPSFMMAYTFVKTFDYTNSAGVNITSDPLNAIQLMPGVKFIANMKNGLQPYISVSMVWNIMDQTKFYANDVQLPQMSINPYVQYGVGVQKRWGERFTGFAQAMVTNGGRNGLGLQMGFRWAI